ncbi:MAG: hypothetical protein K1X72_15820 [Pyrinomonadaceae bacterium]|nr:hypothetical protein [Pyrinomonadaceae bacterium]
MAKVQREIFIETHEVSIIKRKSYFVRAYCELCRREVSLFPPAKAAFLTCQKTEEIYSLMNANKVHYRYFKDDKPFVCLTSLCLV